MTTRTIKKAETVTPHKMHLEWSNGEKETLEADKIYKSGGYIYLKEYDGMHINYRGKLEPKYRTFETLNRENVRRYQRREEITEETRVYTVKVLQKKTLLSNWKDRQVVHVEKQ